jgi:hypothetical protein
MRGKGYSAACPSATWRMSPKALGYWRYTNVWQINYLTYLTLKRERKPGQIPLEKTFMMAGLFKLRFTNDRKHNPSISNKPA